MHDIRTIRDNPAAFDAALSRRGVAPVSSQVLAMDEARRAKILAAETAQAEANKAAREVGAAKGRGDVGSVQQLVQGIVRVERVLRYPPTVERYGSVARRVAMLVDQI